MKTSLKLSMMLLVAALAMPAFADNPVRSAQRAGELVLGPKLEGEVLSLVIKEARAGRSAQKLVTERLIKAGYAPEVAAQVWSGNTLVVGGLSAIEGLATTQIAAGKLNADELAPFLTSEGFSTKASAVQVVHTMLTSQHTITKATFVAALSKQEEAIASQKAAPKLPEKTDEELIMLAETVEFARADTVPNNLVIPPAEEALAKDESEVEALRSDWESNYKQGQDRIEDLRQRNAAMDPAARQELINIGIPASAVKASGCPLNARDLGTVSKRCAVRINALNNWVLDPGINGPQSKERAQVAALALTGWNHTDPEAVEKGAGFILARGVRTGGKAHDLPRNKPAAECFRGNAYAPVQN